MIIEKLYNNPETLNIENTNTLAYPIRKNGKHLGEIYTVRLAENDWGIYNFFAQAELNRATLAIRNGFLYTTKNGLKSLDIPLTPLKEIAEIGPDRRQIHDTFKKVEINISFRAIWGYDHNVITKIN